MSAMPGWKWLTDGGYTWGFLARVLGKALALFVLLNLAFVLADPVPALGRVSLYNGLLAGRERLPYGEDPAAYNLSLFDLNAMFASHTLAGPRPDARRVIVLGDSSVWGVLLENRDTLPACLTEQLPGTRFYNVGYPTMSALKDLLLLEAALAYQPDAIMWLVTLESLPRERQLDAPIVANNPARVRPLIERFGLGFDPLDPRFVETDFIGRTLIGQRRALADWLRLQAYGVAWTHTGIDQVYGEYTPRSNDFDEDATWQGLNPDATLNDDILALDVLRAGASLTGQARVPLLLVNEPIFIADGQNSDVRYNFWYPRWSYDQYRALLGDAAAAEGWPYADLWDAVAPAEFTDSPVHLTPAGSRALCEAVVPFVAAIQEEADAGS
ncbi:MAG: hypothetical protein KME04_08475 [Pleurocapsa minor GSE-CHR-MK-17-07R]|jgi:hypothetical protein|nr:hypothetical protein [Pleurocapsa minor GSE-CHR-MK 17-07R]